MDAGFILLPYVIGVAGVGLAGLSASLREVPGIEPGLRLLGGGCGLALVVGALGMFVLEGQFVQLLVVGAVVLVAGLAASWKDSKRHNEARPNVTDRV